MSDYGREMLQFFFTMAVVIGIAIYLSKKDDK